MNELAILIPTYGRHTRLASVAKNIHDNTTISHSIYFICENNDLDSIKEVNRLNEGLIVVTEGTYVAAINLGFKGTTEPYVFLGSDDIEFTPHWDQLMIAHFKNESIGIVGAMDEWPITQTKLHTSHMLIRRSYIEQLSGVLDEKNTVYSSKYIHCMCDIETEQTAMGRGAFVMSDAFISHKHWFMKTAQWDSTYDRAAKASPHDFEVYYNRRKMFEIYKFDDLFKGIVTPVNRNKFTIIIPNYNQYAYLKQTIESIKANTYNDYELIIIDDGSDEEVKNYIKIVNCVKVFNSKQLYVNHNWNEGIKLSTCRYVCIMNNDITLSKDWDIHLLEQFNDPDVWIASPYQTDQGWSEPYGRHERTGDINIRGVCFMIDKEMINTTGYIPKDFLIWFGDWWLTWVAEKNNKKSVFTEKAIVHHYGSKSSLGMMIDRKQLFFQILRGDCYAFALKTGINVDKWIRHVYTNLELECPV